ncbi:MAG TPA: protein-L-isoaspartate(D-aspartate) O-methyltransferase, partial [Anaerolineae bacterium]|nr:protein-L-isoaspartate(D-aspartate) O-methyltransferase [Anaerolineae bacterium]
MNISGERPPNFTLERQKMVVHQIAARGIKDTRVLEAMNKVPRHLFVPDGYLSSAYADYPLPIGEGQTISQPYIVAFMTESLDLKPDDRVLEIGTGSGYQAAILAEIVHEVYTIEIIESLGERARTLLGKMGYENIFVKIGDGYKGWPDEAPFDAIIVTCAPEDIPPALIEQLKEGGRMIIPVGSVGGVQELVRVVKREGRVKTEDVLPVRFVPMIKGK